MIRLMTKIIRANNKSAAAAPKKVIMKKIKFIHDTIHIKIR